MGFALTIQGCPYKFATGQHTSITSSDAEWPDDATLLPGFLEVPEGMRIEEQVSPLSGDLLVSSLNFRLHDDVATSGVASGYNVMTYLGTRVSSAIVSSTLTADFDAGSLVFGVADGGSFGTGPGYVWIEGECVLFNARVGNAFTISAGTDRGQFGSRDLAHSIDVSNNYYPTVYASFPSFERRKAIFWYVDNDGVAIALWRGKVTRAPRFTQDERQGAVMELFCESLWNISKQRRLGVPEALTHLRGFSLHAINATITYSGGAWIDSRSSIPSTPADFVKPTLADALTAVQRQLVGSIGGAAVTASIGHSRAGARMRVEASVGQPVTATLTIGNQVASDTSRESGDPRHCYATIPNAPSVVAVLPIGTTSGHIPLDDVSGLPSTWTSTPADTNDGVYSTTITPCLVGELSDDELLEILPEEGSSTGASYITGGARVLPRRPGAVSRYAIGGNVIVDRAIPLRLAAKVATRHWAYGLRRAIVSDDETIGSGLDPNDWTWSTLPRVARLTSAGPVAREWYLKGDDTIGDLISDACKFGGCGITVRGSRLALGAFAPPTDSDYMQLTLTRDHWIAKPRWTRFEEGLANSVEFKSSVLNLTVNDSRSIGEFEQGTTVSVKLPGGEDGRLAFGSVQDMANYALSRVIGLWSRPVFTAVFTVDLASWFQSAYCLDFAEVSDWLIPDGQGGRAPSSRRGQIIKRALDLTRGALELTIIFYDTPRAAGYAPAAKVSAISGSTITLATAYLPESNTATDWAGSNLPDYRFVSTYPNDGGCAWFNASDRVKLITRDGTTMTAESYVVQSVSPGTREITFTSAISTGGGGAPDWPALLAAGWVDVIADEYTTAGIQTAQKAFAYVGDSASGVIDGTTDRNRNFAP